MCTFIVVMLDARATDALRRVTPRIGLALVDNRSLREHLSPGERVFSTATTDCDCDTFLGSGTKREKGPKEQREADAWKIFLDAALVKVPSLAILIHEYDGPLTGRVKGTTTESVSRTAIDDVWLARMEQDVVYRVSR